jgi:tRNA1(Val) A37 N6-methylase TrmN6
VVVDSGGDSNPSNPPFQTNPANKNEDIQSFLDRQIKQLHFTDINKNFTTKMLENKTAYIITQPLSLFETRNSDDNTYS